jgi:hypothetical protein
LIYGVELVAVGVLVASVKVSHELYAAKISVLFANFSVLVVAHTNATVAQRAHTQFELTLCRFCAHFGKIGTREAARTVLIGHKVFLTNTLSVEAQRILDAAAALVVTDAILAQRDLTVTRLLVLSVIFLTRANSRRQVTLGMIVVLEALAVVLAGHVQTKNGW